MSKTPDLFSTGGKKPRRKPRKLMDVVDAGQANWGKVIRFKCSHCGHDTGWMDDEQSVSTNKRGIACPICELKNLYQQGIMYGIDLAIALFLQHGADGFVKAVEDYIEQDNLPESPVPLTNH